MNATVLKLVGRDAVLIKPKIRGAVKLKVAWKSFRSHKGIHHISSRVHLSDPCHDMY